jgi:hypothetical protein
MIGRLFWPLIYVMAFCLFSWQIGGDGSPDTRIYHLYNGYAATMGSRPQDIAAAQLQSYFFPGLDALYYRLISATNNYPGLLRLLLGLPYAVAATLVLYVGREIVPRNWPGRELLAGLAALFGLTGAAALSTIGTMMSEVVSGVPLLLGLVIWLRNRHQRSSLAIAGGLAGLSVGLKLTELPLFLGFFVTVTLSNGFHLPRTLRAAVAFGGPGLLVTLVVAGPWLMHNWMSYGNPIFPNFNDVFRSDLVAPGRWSDDRFKPHGFWRVLCYPAFWAFQESHDAIELTMRDPRMLIALVAIVFVLVKHNTSPTSRCLAFFSIVSYVLWEYQFSIYRYLTVLECLSGVLVLAALSTWVPCRFAVSASVLMLLVLGMAAAITRYPWWDRSLPSSHVISAHLPVIPASSLVVFLDPSAMAYLVPFLPREVTVVGANNNLVRPGSGGELQRKIEGVVRGWNGPRWGFENGRNFPGDADAVLSYYGLRRVLPCTPIFSSVEGAAGIACELQSVP